MAHNSSDAVYVFCSPLGNLLIFWRHSGTARKLPFDARSWSMMIVSLFLSLSLSICTCIYIYMYKHIRTHILGMTTKRPYSNYFQASGWKFAQNHFTCQTLAHRKSRSPGPARSKRVQFSCAASSYSTALWHPCPCQAWFMVWVVGRSPTAYLFHNGWSLARDLE